MTKKDILAVVGIFILITVLGFTAVVVWSAIFRSIGAGMQNAVANQVAVQVAAQRKEGCK